MKALATGACITAAAGLLLVVLIIHGVVVVKDPEGFWEPIR